MLRRSTGIFERFSFGSDRPPTIRLPDVTSNSFRSSLMNVDLPDPDGPTRNTNSPLSIWSETSSRPNTPPWYDLVTPSKMIIAWEADRGASGGGGATADLLGTPPGSNAV